MAFGGMYLFFIMIFARIDNQINKVIEEVSPFSYDLFASLASSSAIDQPADSSIAALTPAATTCPANGINFPSSFAIDLIGVFKTCFLSAVIARFRATFFSIQEPNTPLNAIAIVVIVTVSVAKPSPGTGTALPAAAVAACEWIIVWH